MKLSCSIYLQMMLLIFAMICLIEVRSYHPKMNRIIRVGRAAPPNIRGYKKMSIFPRVGRSDPILDEEKIPPFTLTVLNYDKPETAETDDEIQSMTDPYNN